MRMAEVAREHSLPFGYDEMFVNPVDEDFLCPICRLPAKEPIQTSCGHRFCAQCIEEYLQRYVLNAEVLLNLSSYIEFAIIELLKILHLWLILVAQGSSVSNSDYKQFAFNFREIFNVAAVHVKQYRSLDISSVSILSEKTK